MINKIRKLFTKDNINTVAISIVMAVVIYLSGAAYAYTSQSAVYASDIPPNTVCIKDAIPNGWMCELNETPRWYLTQEGRLADEFQ